ncbi:hypothetical protein M5D96_003966 [Drosophila gunungcola]|uniref:Uncharacterized protein n=1 Tax=Drosophila gunungcola TaxID=103775 RepID=A0A9Q0BSU9_9MUSC|nr:hypothetical protein M5D96_003966 [Drosophila gunungcola]
MTPKAIGDDTATHPLHMERVPQELRTISKPNNQSTLLAT